MYFMKYSTIVKVSAIAGYATAIENETAFLYYSNCSAAHYSLRDKTSLHLAHSDADFCISAQFAFAVLLQKIQHSLRLFPRITPSRRLAHPLTGFIQCQNPQLIRVQELNIVKGFFSSYSQYCVLQTVVFLFFCHGDL